MVRVGKWFWEEVSGRISFLFLQQHASGSDRDDNSNRRFAKDISRAGLLDVTTKMIFTIIADCFWGCFSPNDITSILLSQSLTYR